MNANDLEAYAVFSRIMAPDDPFNRAGSGPVPTTKVGRSSLSWSVIGEGAGWLVLGSLVAYLAARWVWA